MSCFIENSTITAWQLPRPPAPPGILPAGSRPHGDVGPLCQGYLKQQNQKPKTMATDEAADTLLSRSDRDGLSCNSDMLSVLIPHRTLYDRGKVHTNKRVAIIYSSYSYAKQRDILVCAISQCCEPSADRGANRLVHFLFCLFASDAAYFSTRRNCAYLLSNCPKDYSRFIQNGRCLLR